MLLATRLARFKDLNQQSPALLWSFIYFFCLLSGYYVLRPVREAMSASNDIEAIFPLSMIDFFAQRGVALSDFTLQVIFTLVFFLVFFLSFQE